MDLVLGTSCEPIELARELENQSSQGITMHQRRQQSSKWTLAANSLLGGLQYLVRGRYTTTGQLWYGEGGICQVPHPPLARRQQTAHDRFSQMKLKPTFVVILES